jgi:RNA polymerase sigma-70 factor (ECF subfamily)
VHSVATFPGAEALDDREMDAEAYRELVIRHKDRVNSYASWVLGDREEGADVTQEALIRLWAHRKRVRPEAAKSWLMKTTYRLCIDHTRRRRVRGEVGSEALGPISDQGPGPDQKTWSGEVGRLIEGALTRLSPPDRAAVLLREVEGMSYDEISRILDLPLGTVKAKLHRSRERLRQDLIGAGVNA